jgi:sulfite dehydrogenase (quinone) subunit SoeC
MNPAMSVVVFTTLCGAAQGLVVTLSVLVLGGFVAYEDRYTSAALVVAGCMLVVSLATSFMHLGRPERAWRAVMMWRTSWLSREVIVLPVFIFVVCIWWLATLAGYESPLFPVLAILGALLLWYCTAMIYICIRFLAEWAHPYTLFNYTLIGLASGLVLSGALASLLGRASLSATLAPCALAVTVMAWCTRALSLRRNRTLKPKSTLQSAIGLNARQIQQKSMGMSAGSFNTREFFHRASAVGLKNIKWGFLLFGFALPALLLTVIMWTGARSAWLVVVPIQYVGLLGERWFFFAQARHPQNLYYQVVS